MPIGMSLDPGGNTTLRSRLVCAKCWTEPGIIKVDGSDMLTITASCHGKQETKTVSKSSLVFTLKFFESEQTE
jgi:hypothetical protein